MSPLNPTTTEVRYACGAAMAAAAISNMHKTFTKMEHELDGAELSILGIKVGVLHCACAPLLGFGRPLLDILSRGVVGTADGEMGPNAGAASFLYYGVQLITASAVVGNWATRSTSLSPVAASLLLTSSASVGLMWSSAPLVAVPYFMGIPVAAGMLAATTRGTAGWWVGLGAKLVAAVQVAVAIATSGPVREGLAAILARGFVGSSEVHGLADTFVGAGGRGAGVAWGAAHYVFHALMWWRLGSHIQDWHARTEKLCSDAGCVDLVANVGMWAICPSSGYAGSVGASMELTRIHPSTGSSNKKGE